MCSWAQGLRTPSLGVSTHTATHEHTVLSNRTLPSWKGPKVLPICTWRGPLCPPHPQSGCRSQGPSSESLWCVPRRGRSVLPGAPCSPTACGSAGPPPPTLPGPPGPRPGPASALFPALPASRLRLSLSQSSLMRCALVIRVLETGDATGRPWASEGQNRVPGSCHLLCPKGVALLSTPPVLGVAGDAGGGCPLASPWRTARAPPPEAASPPIRTGGNSEGTAN